MANLFLPGLLTIALVLFSLDNNIVQATCNQTLSPSTWGREISLEWFLFLVFSLHSAASAGTLSTQTVVQGFTCYVCPQQVCRCLSVLCFPKYCRGREALGVSWKCLWVGSQCVQSSWAQQGCAYQRRGGLPATLASHHLEEGRPSAYCLCPPFPLVLQVITCSSRHPGPGWQETKPGSSAPCTISLPSITASPSTTTCTGSTLVSPLWARVSSASCGFLGSISSLLLQQLCLWLAIPEGGSPTPVFQAAGWAAALKYLSHSPAVSGLWGCHSLSLGQHLTVSLSIGQEKRVEGALWTRELWGGHSYTGVCKMCVAPAEPGAACSACLL